VAVYEYAESEVYHTVWVWTEVGMVTVCVVVSYACMAKELWDYKYRNGGKVRPTEMTEPDLKDLPNSK
jgi:hypothetical protein